MSYNYRFIDKPHKSYKRWRDDNPLLLKSGNISSFMGILCPVSTASVEVTERARAEYDNIELLILKLFAAGIKKTNDIASLTGLKSDMILNILGVLEKVYGHIKDNEVTDFGRQSLREGVNVQSYETVKQVQFEAITGALLVPKLFQTNFADDAYIKNENIAVQRYKPTEYIERDVEADILENFNKYRSYEVGIIERNVEKIHTITVEALGYVEAFLVEYDYLTHPMILFPVQESLKISWYPVSISESNYELMQKNQLKFRRFEPIVRPDREFERLPEISSIVKERYSPDALEEMLKKEEDVHVEV